MVFRAFSNMMQQWFLKLASINHSPTLHRRRRFGAAAEVVEARVLLSSTAPVFSLPEYVFETPATSSTVGVLAATDAEGDLLSYSADNSNFYIDSSSGAVYFYGLAVAGATHSATVTVTDGLASTSALLTVTFTGNGSYEETQQVANTVIDDEYYAVQQEYYETVSENTYSSDYYYSTPDYIPHTVQNEPFGASLLNPGPPATSHSRPPVVPRLFVPFHCFCSHFELNRR